MPSFCITRRERPFPTNVKATSSGMPSFAACAMHARAASVA
ncbi:hypothetical protein AL1_02180 [Alistipes shahii WAL 8301]|uniref:Uncharacterized protein n=1 Tax=Alistipes shahii WAL 8301 TaxID=717959 RepID=D4IJ09_9BACT|nr:hypothetical protein AL1_02180 [Alistipes shahii WAL 8301]